LTTQPSVASHEVATFRQSSPLSKLQKRQQLSTTHLTEIREIFAQIDVDGSGSLSESELKAAMKAMGIYKSRAEVAALIADIDSDGNGKVEVDEFVDLVLALEKQKRTEDCLQRNDAIYSILWQKSGNTYRSIGQYTSEARTRALSRVRGDCKTFASESAKLEIPARVGPISRAAISGEEVVINHGPSGKLVGMQLAARRSLANEFGIKHIHFVPVAGGLVMEYGRIAGEEVEVIKLVNQIMGQILHPVSTRAFFAGLLETFSLLLLLVKMEQHDVLAGLSKAIIAFYDAVLSFEKSLERDVLSAWSDTKSPEGTTTLKRQNLSRKRGRALLFIIRPVFALTRFSVHVVKFVHLLWKQRNAPTVAVKQGVGNIVEVGRKTSNRLGTMARQVEYTGKAMSNRLGSIAAESLSR